MFLILQILGRSLQTTNVTRNRWFDMPLTREESLQSDKKLVINFGPSSDAEAVTMVDSVKVRCLDYEYNLYDLYFSVKLNLMSYLNFLGLR